MSENPNEINFFAKTNFRNREVPFGIKQDDRRRHMYVIGKTGMGKTTMMENMVIQDIRNGHGVCFIDPHGDSVAKILDYIPSSRVNDVVYFNPADIEYPIAFNILEAVDTKYKHLVASGLMGVFTKIWANLWSARMEYILNNTILALLDSPGNTMMGIARMYIDKKYRKKIVDNIKDPMVKAFWVDEFAQYSEKYRTEAIAPIQNKVGQFLSSGIVRNIVGQPRSTIDLRSIMDNRKILLMDLSKGKVGEDNSALLGAMIITKLQLAALSRVDIPENERKDFYLYVDEFQNFVTESFATILSEARKYHLNLTVGHQYIGQLSPDKNNTRVRDAVFGNVGTMVCFRVGAADAEFLETEFDPTFTPNDMVNLPKYNIILRLMINGVASDPFSAVTMPVNESWATGNAEKVIKVSRERYANPVIEVEEKIMRWMGAETHEQIGLIVGRDDEDDSAAEENGSTKSAIENVPEVAPQPAIEKPIQMEQAMENTVNSPVSTKEEVEKDKTVSEEAQQPHEQHIKTKLEQLQTQISQLKTIPAKQQPKPLANTNNSNVNRKNQNFHNPNKNRFNKNSNFKQNSNNNRHKNNKNPKRDNPVWDTVAQLNQEKVSKDTTKIFEPGSKTESVSSSNSNNVVLPGQVHKF